MNAIEERKRLVIAKDEAERAVKRELERLSREAEHLAQRMTEVARKAKSATLLSLPDHRGKFYSPINSLGEVQGRGADVDMSCARLEEKIDRLNYLRWISGADFEESVG